jgi:hypothetical protein
MTDHFRHSPLDVVEFQQALPRFRLIYHQTADAIDERAWGITVREKLKKPRNGLGQYRQQLAAHLAEALGVWCEILFPSGGIDIAKPKGPGDAVRCGRRYFFIDHNPPQSPKHDIGTAIRKYL